MITIKAREAYVEIHDCCVYKNYYDKSKNKIDYDNLKAMRNVFGTFEHNGWKYDFVKTTELTADKGIAMERVEGSSFIDDESFDEEHYYHAGKWLGHLHNPTNVKRGG